ncbi:LysE family translocator [Saccharothrix syringae]|uniref:LysE family translocator n=1 Tax=Saccharothrix syringae TaxID=103733 RepID=UPI00052460CD|nr:LysE family translocator [Saccharothrix syringae]
MLEALLAFFAVATVVIVTPGPDSFLVLRNTVGGGYAGGVATAAGVATGLVLWGAAAGVGLSALVAASRIGHNALHVGGAAYLVWLGVSSLRSSGGPLVDQAPRPAADVPRGRMYALGLLSNLLNPKIGVFFVAFLPGFVPAGEAVGPFSAALGLAFAVETGLWLVALSWMAVRGVHWLRRPPVRRVLDRVTGVLFIGFGVRLITDLR